ncbi:hypothetical protein [Mycobacterium helveticum]|uniref:Uncharacterized protein n=1 Tax=Mycobacterium helveticum TaxID=2592811 RepID=A0A557XND1_9MYCO|nr:hypothetical protein [Mycobacterium helveticum]TVS78420.1 hypothetical protein FPZ46_22705 [Mycobacterium helveticum]TVS87354.1 hypothetical protein FPZ47_16060 [Mycobacterium helveticum]
MFATWVMPTRRDASSPEEGIGRTPEKTVAGNGLEAERSTQHRMAMIERHIAGLQPGWYVLDGFFWDDVCSVLAGPFATQADALTCRSALERDNAPRHYYIDEVGPRLPGGTAPAG